MQPTKELSIVSDCVLSESERPQVKTALRYLHYVQIFKYGHLEAHDCFVNLCAVLIRPVIERHVFSGWTGFKDSHSLNYATIYK